MSNPTNQPRIPTIQRDLAALAVTAALKRAATAPDHQEGVNAEDCPACAGTNPPYPFLCPGDDRYRQDPTTPEPTPDSHTREELAETVRNVIARCTIDGVDPARDIVDAVLAAAGWGTGTRLHEVVRNHWHTPGCDADCTTARTRQWVSDVHVIEQTPPATPEELAELRAQLTQIRTTRTNRHPGTPHDTTN